MKPRRFAAWLVLAFCAPLPVLAGGSCVVAKAQGHSLAVAWAASPKLTQRQALEQAEAELFAAGHRGKRVYVHSQAGTDLPRGHLVIVKAAYRTLTGRDRVSFGCGFSAVSPQAAGQAALENLQAYSWGWKPEMGYEVYQSLGF